MNLQPSEAQVGLDVRVPPNANPEELERRIAEEWAPSSRNMTFEVCALRACYNTKYSSVLWKVLISFVTSF